MAFRSDLDALILGVLQAGQLHGYEITKRINRQGETVLSVKEGQLYPILHRLENDGMIAAEWIPQEGKPARKVYSLTRKGHGELAQKQQAWIDFARRIDTILRPAQPEVSHEIA